MPPPAPGTTTSQTLRSPRCGVCSTLEPLKGPGDGGTQEEDVPLPDPAAEGDVEARVSELESLPAMWRPQALASSVRFLRVVQGSGSHPVLATGRGFDPFGCEAPIRAHPSAHG